jgi:ribosomal protein S12 methylthiotransferase accessory factor
LDDHSAYAGQRRHRGEFAFLSRSGARMAVGDLDPRAPAEPATELERCASLLRDLGHPAAAVDLTLPDVRECGFHVARVIVDGLQPIHFGFGEERLGGRRLFSLPHTLGFTATPTTIEELNPCPHPLA